jgi:hypothetical protein
MVREMKNNVPKACGHEKRDEDLQPDESAGKRRSNGRAKQATCSTVLLGRGVSSNLSSQPL